MPARIVGIKVWASMDVRFSREVSYGFGANAEAAFDEGMLPNDDKIVNQMVLKESDRLFAEIVQPTLNRQLKRTAEKDELFKLAIQTERPKIVKRYRKMLEN